MPVPTEHPAQRLTAVVSKDIREQLLKVPSHLATEDEAYAHTLGELRNDWRFAYVVQWLYNFRGLVRMAGDTFDVDMLEEELVGIAPSSPFITRLQTNLIHTIRGGASRAGTDLFETHVRRLFGYNTPLRGVDPAEAVKGEEEYDAELTFALLNALEKVEVLYLVVEHLTAMGQFRAHLDKHFPNASHQADLRPEVLYTVSADEAYYLLDDCRLYSQSWKYPAMGVPKKRKHGGIEPIGYEVEPITTWRCLTVGIYEYHAFIKKHAKNRKLHLALTPWADRVAEQDLVRRKQILARRKTIQMASLLIHRKKSSRLEAKAKEREEEEAKERALQEAAEREAEAERQARRLALRNGMSLRSMDLSPGVEETREERHRRREEMAQRQRLELAESSRGAEMASPVSGLSELWEFDCAKCGTKGTNYDDAKEMLKCERCCKWQHVQCQSPEVQQMIHEDENYRFVGIECAAATPTVTADANASALSPSHPLPNGTDTGTAMGTVTSERGPHSELGSVPSSTETELTNPFVSIESAGEASPLLPSPGPALPTGLVSPPVNLPDPPVLPAAP